jgi:hypothetical protein
MGNKSGFGRIDGWAHSVKQQYPSLYNIVRKKSDTVEKNLSRVPLNVSFQRYLTRNNLCGVCFSFSSFLLLSFGRSKN